VWKSGYDSYHKTGIIINVKQSGKHNHTGEMAYYWAFSEFANELVTRNTTHLSTGFPQNVENIMVTIDF
jgi:hypothetical protein